MNPESVELAEPVDVAEPARGRAVGLLALGLLQLNALLLAAFGVAFTPMFVGGVPVPMGVLFTALVLPWLVLRTGELDPRPGIAAAPVALWFAGVAALAVAGPGGDVMVPMWWQSGLLLVAGLGSGLWAWRQVVTGG